MVAFFIMSRINASAIHVRGLGTSRPGRVVGSLLVIVLVLTGQAVHLPTAHSSTDHSAGHVMATEFAQSADAEAAKDSVPGDPDQRACSGPECGGCIAFVSNPAAVPVDPGYLPPASPAMPGSQTGPDRHSRPPPTLVA